MLHKWEGYVLRTHDYGEANKIVVLMTREAGKVAVMARGARRPKSRLAAMTQVFTHGQFMVQRYTGMGTLNQAEPLEALRHLRSDISAMAYGSYIVELLDRVVEEGNPEPFAFDVLQYALQAIDEQDDPEAVALVVAWKLLPYTGVQPILHACAGCGATEGEFAFSFTQGGFLCHNCFSLDPYIIRLKPVHVRLIRMFYTVPIDQIGKITLKPATKRLIKTIISTIYEEQTGIQLKSKKFIDQLDKMQLPAQRE